MTIYYMALSFATAAAWISDAFRSPRSDRSVFSRLARQHFALGSGLVLIAVAALRWRVGTDYWTYERLYTRYVTTAWADLRITEEPGLPALAKLGHIVTPDYAMMFALAAGLTCGLSVWALYRNSSLFSLAVFFYVTTGMWHFSFNVVRQSIACAILLAGHRLILERRFPLFLLVVGAASLFHIGAIVAVLLYWVPTRRIGAVRGIVLLLLALAASTAYDTVASVLEAVRGREVTGDAYWSESLDLRRVLAAFVPLAAFLAFKDKFLLDRKDYFYVNTAFIYAVVLLASIESAYVARLALFPGAFLPLALVSIVRSARGPGMKRLLTFASVVAYLVYWTFEISSSASISEYHWLGDR